MATFGKQFLQQMANPSFGKGLFTAAQQIGAAPARRRMQEQLASATPLERFDLAIAQLTRSGELEKAAKLTAARDKYVAEQQTRTDNNITNIVASQMLATNSTEVPETITYGGKQVSIPPRLSGDILQEVNTLQSSMDARETAIEKAKLTPEYDAYLKANPQLLEQNPMLDKTYKNVTNPDSGMLRTQRVSGINALIKLVDDDRATRREARTGEKALGVQIEGMIERIKERGSKTPFWKGTDMADFLEDADKDELKLFKEQAVLKLQQDPNASEVEIIDYAMTGMRSKIPGEEQSRAITENERLRNAMFEEIVTDLMKELNISREQAEVEAVRRTGASPANINAVIGAGFAL